jgi:hypothetical protein
MLANKAAFSSEDRVGLEGSKDNLGWIVNDQKI